MARIRTTLKAVTLGTALSLSALAAHAADLPKTLKIAAAFPAGVESAWVKSWIDAFERVQAEQPHGVELELAYTENVFGDKGLSVIEEYADSGEYDIIWAHSSFSDEVEELKDDFDEVLFVTVGAGNRPLGDNSYLIYMHLHEPSFLTGVYAGKTSKSGKLGAVGLFPADDVNDQINAFRAGAQSVNPDVEVSVTFIESWYDPVKAAEAVNAQVAAGADLIYQLGEAFQTCREKEIQCIGNYIDSSKIAPDVVPTSALVYWDPHINYVIDEWKTHKETGEPYDAPAEKVWFSMADGGGDIAAYNSNLSIADDAKAAVAEARDRIISGDLQVELDMSLPVSD